MREREHSEGPGIYGGDNIRTDLQEAGWGEWIELA